MDNKKIAKLLKLAADLMEVKGENGFKISAFQRAARAIETLGTPVEEYVRKGILSEVQGIGASTKKAVLQILEKETFDDLEIIQSEIPTGVQEMLKMKGIGPKKVQHFWISMGIESLGELYYACVENRLAQEKGFGKKTQDSIQLSIEFLESNKGKIHFAKAVPIAEMWEKELQNLIGAENVQITGEIRRQCEIITQVIFLIQQTKQTEVLAFVQQKNIENETIKDNTFVYKMAEWAISMKLIFVENIAKELFYTSATSEHIAELQTLGEMPIHFTEEKDIYTYYQLPFIVPAMREGRGEVAKAKAGNLPTLIEMADIKGVIHAHSTYSDGANTLKDMALACKKMGYEYLVISDHSKAAFYANGLSEGRIEVQHQEIDKLNAQISDFHIFKSIEADILNDGSLDYEEETLKTFDCIIASVHSNLRMDSEKANVRLIKAIENPFTRILGHPTGRLLLARNGYPIDHQKIIDACAANKVVIELNANPHRLDLDWRWIDYALTKNVMIAINPDAHSIEGINDIRWGIAAAQKGGLYKEMCLNNKGLSEFKQWLIAK